MRLHRKMARTSLLFGLLLLLALRCYAASPVALGGQRHMFIDDMLISDKTNVTFQVHPPELRTAILPDTYPWENLSEYSNVIDDGTEYKLYYGNTGNFQGVCLATSTDGLNWVRPMLGLISFNGSTQNNIVIKGTASGSVYYDTHEPNPNRRYKYFTCQTADDLPGTVTAEGMVLYTSPDGIHFTKNEVSLLPFNADSQAVLFWDNYINKYVCYMRGSTDATGRLVVRGETDDPMQPWPYTPSPNPNMGGHEIPFVSTELPTVLKTDANDPTGTDIYGNQVFLYPWAYKVYLAFPTCYYHYQGDRAYLSPSGPGNVGVGECQIAVSRDGVNWTRYRRPEYAKHGWYQEHYCYWPWALQGMIRRDDKIYQYIRIRPTAHGGGEFMPGGQRLFMEVGVFEQQPDRFVGASFDYTGGTMTTSSFTFDGNRLSLNVDTGGMGEGRVGILKADGTPYPGFEVENCDIVNGDWFNKIVSWNRGQNDVSSLAGKTVRLRFEMRGATLYAQQFVWGAPPATGYPHPPEQFAGVAGNGQVTLMWRNPSTADFAGTLIRFKTDSYPTSASDGTLIYNGGAGAGSTDLFTHTGLTNGVTYYYSAFAYDSTARYSDPAQASASPHSMPDWLDEPFDGYNNAPLGGQGGWSMAAGVSAEVQSSQAKGGAGKALLMDTIASGNAIGNVIGVTNKTTGSVLLSFDVRQDATGAVGQGTAYLSVYGSTSSEIARVLIQQGRLFVDYGSGSQAILSMSAANLTWYNVKLGFNIDARTLDLWLDGVSKGSGFAWKGTATDLCTLVLASERNANLNPQKAYVDNLRLEPKPGQVASVTDDGAWSPSVSKLHFSFPAVPGTTEYQYAVGTTSGGTQTMGWTSCGTSTDVLATGLTLAENAASYYVSVRCVNQSGTAGSVRTSNGIKIGVGVAKIKDAKSLPDGTATQVKALRAKLVSAPFSGYFYIQEPDGPYGLKAVSTASVSAGDQVDVCGVMKGAGAERYLDGTGNGVIRTTGPGAPRPVVLKNAAIGGTSLNAYAPGVAGGIGPNNIGLFVTVSGKVTQRQTTPTYFYIDDGSGLADGSTTGGAANVGLRVIADPSSYPAGSYVSVTGVVSSFSSSGLRPQILPQAIQILDAR